MTLNITITLICLLISILTLSQFLMLSGRVGYLENSVDNLSAIVVEMQSQGTESSHKVDAREEGMSIENSLIMEASYD
jgi:hypothetical protein